MAKWVVNKLRIIKLKDIIIFNLMVIIMLMAISRFYDTWTNTLYRNNNWESTKVQLEKGLMGAWSFMLSHRALAHSHLDPGTWHGFQEVFYKKPIEFIALDFDFKLDEESWFMIYFHQNGDTLSALRLSSDAGYPSGFIKILDQEFIEKIPLNFGSNDRKWHHLKIDYQFGNVFVDGDILAEIPANAATANVLGFKGSLHPAYLDNISFIDNKTGKMFYERFEKNYSHFDILFILLILSNILFILLYKRKSLSFVVLANALAVSLAISVFYVGFGQEYYPKEWMIKWQSKVSTIEDRIAVAEKIVKEYASLESESSEKIIFIGSSQTWGAGASEEEKTIVKRYEQMLNRSDSSMQAICINAGISGANSGDLIRLYEDEWINIKPDWCIVNLSHNDGGSPEFSKNLEKFIRINDENDVKTIFILEPIAWYDREHFVNHDIMREVASENNIILVDMHQYLQEHYDDGFLYWDFIHLTDFGQFLFAKELHRQTKDLFHSK